MAMLLANLKVPLTWREVSSRSIKEAMADTYYFFFSLFPALLLLMAIASYFSVADTRQ